MFLPCQHIPGHGEPLQIPMNESNKMCYACSLAFDECPQCKRVIEKRVKVHRGSLTPLVLAIISFLQMTLPAVCAKWNFMHSACLQRDIDPIVTTSGCNLLLAICVVMLFLGLLGIRIADKSLEMKKYINLYLFLTALGAIYSGTVFIAYVYGLLRIFSTVSSEFEITLVRNMGFPDRCVSEIMTPHAFKNLPPNTCVYDDQDSIFYNFFSCRPCDKTSPASCFGSLKYESQQTYTNWATTAYGTLCVVDLFGIIAILALDSSLKRFKRESTNRSRPIVINAKNAFKQLLSEQKDIVPSSTFKKSQAANSKDTWQDKIRFDKRFDPLFKTGQNSGEKILSDKDRQNIFNDYVEKLIKGAEEKKDSGDLGNDKKFLNNNMDEGKEGSGTNASEDVLNMMAELDDEGHLLSMGSGDEIDNGLSDGERSGIDSDAAH
eukprot:g4116.t1